MLTSKTVVEPPATKELHHAISKVVIANIMVTSLIEICIFITKKCDYRIELPKKTSNLILKKASLRAIALAVVYEAKITQMCFDKPDIFTPESSINQTIFQRQTLARQPKLRSYKQGSVMSRRLFLLPTYSGLPDTPVICLCAECQ